MARKKRLETRWVCECDLLHDTEKQARNCIKCGPRQAYLCSTCGEPKFDYEAAEQCCATASGVTNHA